MDISIIIVSYNNFDVLQNCLNSIYKFTSKISFEIIVVDNNSVEEGLTEVVDGYSNLVLIKNNENMGFSFANNQGLGIAKGRYILFLNNDTELVKDILYKLVEFSDSSESNYLIGVKLLNTDLTHQHSIVDFTNLWNTFTESFFFDSIFKKSKYFNKYWMNYPKHSRPVKVDVVLGAFIFASAKTINELGGFDTRFYFYAEETDLCKRFKNLGGNVLYYPDLELIHIGGVSTNHKNWFHFKNQHRGKIQFAQKHFSPVKLFLFLILHYSGLLVRIPLYLILGIIKFDKNYFLKAYFFIRQLVFYPRNGFVKK